MHNIDINNSTMYKRLVTQLSIVHCHVYAQGELFRCLFTHSFVFVVI